MSRSHIIAVFKAEYYTTTARFRSFRNWIPLFFITGVILFSLILRTFYDILRNDIEVGTPDIPAFFSIIVVFSYFTLFAPLLSPLGRIVYDNDARSRREVALASPVKSRDLLFGNLLSNLAFFLPFFAFVGTASLAPFVGSGNLNPFITSTLLFITLSLLILIGLVAGTIISPIIYNLISKRRSDISRAIVTLSVSSFMILSLPLLRYFLENASVDNPDLGPLQYLPFTLASSIIIYALYGIRIGVDIQFALLLLLAYVIVFFIFGWFTANWLYGLSNEELRKVTINDKSTKNHLFMVYTSFIPFNYRNTTRAILKASLRDIEHLSRLTIGLAITIFMLFALSSRGLFRTTANFEGNIELAITLFSLVLSAASVIFIEASSFTVQHRDMFALIKSAPYGSKKFIISKAVQMSLIIFPVYILMMMSLSFLDFISWTQLIQLAPVAIAILMTLICLSLAIYLINPADNEEDLTNFINLLVFYVFAFAIAIAPVAMVIADIKLQLWHYVFYFTFLALISIISLLSAIKALDKMDLETLNSNFSKNIIMFIQAFILFGLGWNVIPIISLLILIFTQNIFIVLLTSTLFTLILPMLSYKTGLISNPRIKKIYRSNIQQFIRTIVAMFSLGFIFSAIYSIFSKSVDVSPMIITQLDISFNSLIFLVIIIVIVEELFFRWFILEYSRKQLNKKFAYLLNGILFGLIHFYPLVSFFNAFTQAILLSKLKEDTDSIFWPILAHLIYNITIIILIF